MKKKFKPEELIESVDAFPVPILKIAYPNHQSLRKTIVPIFLEMERWDIETSKPYTANSATTYGNSFEKYLKKSVNKNLPGYGDRTRPNYSSALRAPALEEEPWIGHEILLALPQLKGLKEFILNISRFANRFIGVQGDLMFSGSWMSINRQYGFHGAHGHMPCLWSGVYYVQALKDDAPITFIDANKKNNWPSAYGMFTGNQYSSPTFSLEPESGNLLLFPSWLEHQVEQQMVPDRERITISFNLVGKPSDRDMLDHKQKVKAAS